MEPKGIFKGQTYTEPMQQELESGGKFGPEALMCLQCLGVGFPCSQKLFIRHISLEGINVDSGQKPDIFFQVKSMGEVQVPPGMQEDSGIVLQKPHPKGVVGIYLMKVVHKETGRIRIDVLPLPSGP